MLTTDLCGRIITWWFFVNLLFITAWDVVMIVMQRRYGTVSYQMYLLFQEHPLLYLLAGVIIGHLIVPLAVLLPNGN